jgi:hypothetical protein
MNAATRFLRLMPIIFIAEAICLARFRVLVLTRIALHHFSIFLPALSDTPPTNNIAFSP